MEFRNIPNKEKERILSVYKDLDSSGISARYDYLNPAYLFHMYAREREILSFLNKKGIDIRGGEGFRSRMWYGSYITKVS